MEHTIIISRHFQHNNNVGTEQGKSNVVENSKKTKKEITKKGEKIADTFNINIRASNQPRTQETAKLIANTLTGNEETLNVLEKSYLNLNPKSGPMKKTIDLLNKYYDKDPDVLKIGHSDAFVRKLQNDELEGISFKKLSLFYCTKLRNALSYIKRNPDKSNLSIVGIHGGYFFESVIFGLFQDEFPQERAGQIHMGEQAILNLKKDEDSYKLIINYRDTEMEISEAEINKKIKILRKNVEPHITKQSSCQK